MHRVDGDAVRGRGLDQRSPGGVAPDGAHEHRSRARAAPAIEPPSPPIRRRGRTRGRARRVPRSMSRAGARTTSTTMSPTTTTRGRSAARRVRTGMRARRDTRMAGTRPSIPAGSTSSPRYDERRGSTRRAVCADDARSDAPVGTGATGESDDPRHGPARSTRDRHHPDARDRRRPAGELRASRRADGRGADGLRAVDAAPPPRAGQPALAEPRPLRPVRRATRRCSCTRCST